MGKGKGKGERRKIHGVEGTRNLVRAFGISKDFSDKINVSEIERDR